MKYNSSPRRWLLALSGVLLLATVSLSHQAFADGKKERHNMDPGEIAEHIVEKMDERLDLSDAQEEGVHKIVTEFFEKKKMQREARKEKMRALWTRPTLTADDVYAAITEKDATRETQQRLMAEKLAAVHALLTPEQRQKAAQYWRQFTAHDGRGHGKHGKYGKHGKCRGWFRGWFGRE